MKPGGGFQHVRWEEATSSEKTEDFADDYFAYDRGILSCGDVGSEGLEHLQTDCHID